MSVHFQSRDNPNPANKVNEAAERDIRSAVKG